ncbi:MAG: thioesterase family protein, partial [Cellvibrionaceae bacterium]|nr:thioesterase family protein [Cellvibrionaceae bacterium]
MSVHEFDWASQMKASGEREGQQLWQLEVSDRWSFGSAPNGGYMAALLAKAAGKTLSRHHQPMSVTSQYILPAKPEQAEIAVKVLREGGRFSQVSVELRQQGQVCVQQSGVFTDFGQLKGPSHFEGEVPQFPPVEAGIPVSGANASFRHRVDARWFADGGGRYWPDGNAPEMSNGGWIKMSDGREPDALALLVFADAFPRAMAMRTGKLGWIPTVDMTVQVLQPPAPGYIAARFRSQKLYRGVVE